MTDYKTAFIFPGQGSQYVGMGRDLYEGASDHVKAFFDMLCSMADFDLKKVCFDGPQDLLDQTVYSQPAIFAVSMLCLVSLQEAHPELRPWVVAGLSLGEYSALCCARVLSYEEAMPLVCLRGRLMHAASQNHPGAMASIIGLDEADVRALCEDHEDTGYVCVANVNCPKHIVVSGEPKAVASLCDFAKKQGAMKTIPLAVSGAFHSRLMKEASDKLGDVLKTVPLKSTAIPVISNVTAQTMHDNDEIVSLLARQVCETVLWEKSVVSMIQQGVNHFIEIGPGRVLKGLLRRIDRDKRVDNVETRKDLQEALEALQ